MRTIEITENVWEEIAKRGKFGETEDDVLRRVFDLPNNNDQVTSQNYSKKTTRRRIGSRRSFANQRMTPYIDNKKLFIEFQNGNSSSWLIPDRDDKLALRELYDNVIEFCKSNGASTGQINAARKTLTSEGYHLTR